MSEAESYLVVEGLRLDWGARVCHLRALTSEAEWRGEAPLEPAAALGIAPAPGEGAARVAVLSAAGRPLPVRIASRASIEQLKGAPPCPMPRALLGARAEVFEAVVFDAARSRPLLIVDPERLAARRLPVPSPEGGAAP